MERSRKIFLRIASASHRVITTANEYADRKDMFGVQRSHFQLEEEMRRISVACECIARILSKPSPDRPAVDVRLQDWLCTDEPRICFDILSQMERLLQEDVSIRIPNNWRAQSITAAEDKIDEAFNVLDARKGCFHFLFETEIWNHESCAQHQQDVPCAGDSTVPGVTNVLEQGVLDASVHMDGRGVRRRKDMTKGRVIVGGETLDEILKWLDGLNCAEKQDITLSLRQPDTCKWFFTTPQYKSWRDGQSSFLWLQGKPGAGKSVLVSFVIDSLENSLREGEILSFFYCDFRNERSTCAAEVMRSILSQLLGHLRNDLVDPGNLFADLAKSKDRGGATHNSAKQLAGFVSDAAKLWSQKPLVIVDALDECKDVRELLQALIILREHVQLFVTSRPLQVIRDGLSGLPFVSMDEMVDRLAADIELHVTRELDARRRLRDLEAGFKMEIRSVLCCKADGMFRWVQCSMDTLDRCVTRKEVRKALDSLPEGLDETYKRILLAIDTKTREGQLALRALVWLVAALRPLCLIELVEALSINLQTRTLDHEFGPMHGGALLDACGSLVTYSEKTGIIVLSHFSVKEYLIDELALTKLPRYHINWERAHSQLARTCMCYISLYLRRVQEASRVGSTSSSIAPNSDISYEHSFTSASGSQPLLDYALGDALDHFRHLGPRCRTVLHHIKVLEADVRRCASLWDNICLHAKRGRPSLTPSWPTSRHDFMLYILIAFAPNSLLDAFLRHATLKPKAGTNPLVYASYFNKDEHAQTLLRRGAELNCRGWEIAISRQAFPLEVALDYRHYAMVTLLVEEGSVVPQHIFTHLLSDRYDPVEIPASTAKILLQTSDFVEAANGLLHEPVSQFALISCEPLLVNPSVHEQDLLNIIRRLVQVGCDPFACNSRGATSLQVAVEHGHLSIVQYLISLGAAFPSDLLMALGSWNIWKRVPILHCLVENGADVLVRTGAGDSILHIALVSFIEDDALVAATLLIRRGCDPLEANSRGETPLQIAIGRGHVSVVRSLLSLGAPLPRDVLLTLESWELSKKFPMIHCLVENGAHVATCTSDGDSILHIALASLNEDKDALEASKLLINHGCDALKANSCGETPLHLAVARGHVSVVGFLLSRGVPLPESELLTLKLWGDSEKAPMVWQFLIENAADVLVRCSAIRDSLLHLILHSLNEDSALKAVKILDSHGCVPLGADPWRQSILQIAIQQERVSVVRYLLSLGTPLPPGILITLDSWKFWKKTSMIHLLIQNGASILARAPNGNSVLHIALRSLVEEDAFEAVKILVAQGCDPLDPDSRGDTPLEIAVGRGHISVVKSLLSFGATLPPEMLLMVDLRSTLEAPSIVRFLVENGAGVVVRTRDGTSLLHTALQFFDEKDALETAKLLISHGCDALESCGQTFLHIAASRGHVSVIRLFLSLGVPLPSQLLITLGSWDIWKRALTLRFLVDNGADVLVRTKSTDSVLHITLASFTEGDALEAAKLLVSRGCNPHEVNSHGKTPLRTALERGHISVVRYFLSLGVPLPSQLLLDTLNSRNVPKRTPMIRCLLENGADVSMRTNHGDTLLHIALKSFVEEYALEATKVLVHYGCDPLASNSRGTTPMHIAVRRGQISVVKYFHSIGTRSPSDLLFILLNSKKYLNASRMLRFFVEEGANVFERTSNGDSVLHVAISSLPSDEVCSAAAFLVEHGCNPAASNNRGVTPLHIAMARGHIGLVDYLQSLNIPLPPNILFSMVKNDCSSGNMAIMLGVLIKGGANVHTVTNNGDTLLHAAIGCTLDVIKFLVTSGCSPQTPNAAGHTPLYVAIIKGYVDVVAYLLSVVDVPQLEDLLPATALAPGNVQYQIRSMLTALLATSAILEHPTAKEASANSDSIG